MGIRKSYKQQASTPTGFCNGCGRLYSKCTCDKFCDKCGRLKIKCICEEIKN